MSYTITDTDLLRYVEGTLAEPGFDAQAIADALRPHIEFGDVSPSDWMPDYIQESFEHAVDKTSALIDHMLKTSGIDEDAYWQIVWAHPTH